VKLRLPHPKSLLSQHFFTYPAESSHTGYIYSKNTLLGQKYTNDIKNTARKKLRKRSKLIYVLGRFWRDLKLNLGVIYETKRATADGKSNY